MQLAFCSHQISKDNIDQWIERFNENDIDTVEIGYPFFQELDVETVARECEKLKKNGIRLWSVHAPFGHDANLSAIEKDVRAGALERHREAIQKAKAAGAEVLVVHPGRAGEGDKRETALSFLVENMEELTGLAAESGLKLALENMLPDHPGDKPHELLSVIKALDSPWVGVCFDTGHAHVCGDMPGAFEKLKDFIITFHLADNDGTRDLHLQPGYGTIHWEDFLELFETMDFDDPVVVETEPWAKAEPGWMFKEVHALLDNRRLTVKDICPSADGKAANLITRCPVCGHQPTRTDSGWTCRCGSST